MISEGLITIFSILSRFFKRNSSAFAEYDESARRLRIELGKEINI